MHKTLCSCMLCCILSVRRCKHACKVDCCVCGCDVMEAVLQSVLMAAQPRCALFVRLSHTMH